VRFTEEHWGTALIRITGKGLQRIRDSQRFIGRRKEAFPTSSYIPRYAESTKLTDSEYTEKGQEHVQNLLQNRGFLVAKDSWAFEAINELDTAVEVCGKLKDQNNVVHEFIVRITKAGIVLPDQSGVS
jgi:hypothetical protein